MFLSLSKCKRSTKKEKHQNICLHIKFYVLASSVGVSMLKLCFRAEFSHFAIFQSFFNPVHDHPSHHLLDNRRTSGAQPVSYLYILISLPAPRKCSQYKVTCKLPALICSIHVHKLPFTLFIIIT